jgi:hypothetical protein
MVRVVQCQHEDLRQRLAWDPGIAGLSSSLTDRGEWTIAGESYSNFPLSFSVERSTRLRVPHGGLAVPHSGISMCS